MKMAKKILKILGCLVLIPILAIAALYPGTRIVYRDFFDSANKEFPIPGLSDGFIPQGLDYSEEEAAYIICGYVSKGASRVYTVRKNGTAVKTELKNQDGSDYTGHTGGVSHFQNYLYITAEDGLDVFPLDEILNGNTEVKKIGSVPVGLDPAYCHIENGVLITGSFYRKGNYETPKNQRRVTPSGDPNPAVAVVFKLDQNSPFGILPEPIAAFSTRGLVQGLCITGKGEIVLSASYATATSELCFYDPEKAKQDPETFSLNGTEIPLFWLDGGSLIKTVKAPPMSEEILCRNGRIYIMTESASNKYIFGKFTGASTLYSIPAE